MEDSTLLYIIIASQIILILVLAFTSNKVVEEYDITKFVFDNCIMEGSTNATMQSGNYYIRKHNSTLCVIQYVPPIQ